MSQRVSGYARKPNDGYETPEWVTFALLPHLQPKLFIWEPAAGSGKIVQALVKKRHIVYSSDIADGGDFLQQGSVTFHLDAIVTNPPYALAQQFIVHALRLTYPISGIVAMLLRTDYDHAKTRVHLFDRPPFCKKLVLTKRIQWFEDFDRLAQL